MKHPYPYEPADTSIWIHNWGDAALHPIEIPLPPCPDDITKIPNYGLPPEEQFFRYTEMPQSLRELDKLIRAKKKSRNDKTFDKITDEDRWAELLGNPIRYRREMLWIQREIKRCRAGYWWFSKGKPTYMNGWCYKTLNYWPVGNDAKNNRHGLPFYNRRLRDWFLAIEYAYTTTDIPHKHRVVYFDKGQIKYQYFNNAVDCTEFADVIGGVAEEGTWILKGERRAFYGVNNPKHRRTLATFGSMSIADSIVSQQRERFGGVQSKNLDSAMRAYSDKFIKPWQSLPFWLRPIHDGMDTPKSGLNYQFPGSKKGRRTDIEPLNGWFTPESGKESAFDGDKLHVVVQDELWKENLADVVQRINIIKPAMATGAGSNIIGLMIGISTVGEFDGGGRRFQQFAQGSHWEDRDANGQTTTGMMNLFFPAYYCLENYVDKYGDPVIDDPPAPVEGIDGRMIGIGAKTFIKNRIDDMTKKKQWRDLNKFVLDHPMEWQDLFRKNVSESSYNVNDIQDRISYLRSLKGTDKPWHRYRLDWIGGVKFGKVVAVPDPNGLHIGSYLPPTSKQNRVQYSHLYEMNGPAPEVIGNFYAGLDPFRLNRDEQSGGGGSDQGLTIYYRFDPILDGDRERKDWVSDDMVWAYLGRPETTDDAHEEALKACILFGALLFGENNIPDFDRNFKEWGYGGYLLHLKDPETGKVKVLSGISNVGNVGERLFLHFGNFLTHNTDRCKIPEVLEDALNVGHHSYMTDHDLFTASCLAYYAGTHLEVLSQRYDMADTAEGEDYTWMEML